MPLPVIWRDDALDALAEIIAYIDERNPLAAQKLEGRIRSLAEGHSAHPYMFRPGRVAGIREAVEITTIIHARRQYP